MAKRRSKVPPTVEENPDWLLRDPEGGLPPPPVVKRATELPFTDLPEWRDFERLCRRLAERDGNVEHVLSYGTPGQAQYGIDILVRLVDGTYEVWQTKRYKHIRPAEVRAAIGLFLAHRWASQAKKFVLAVACNLESTGVVEAIEEARDSLVAKTIAFEPVDAAELSARLICEPEIVDDYFGRPWAQALCPPEALEMLARRLSRFGLEDLRRALTDWYMSWIATIDPGLPVSHLGRSGRVVPAIPITKRYIRPDILVRVAEPPPSLASRGDQDQTETASDSAESAAEAPRTDMARSRSDRTSASTIQERRVELDRFLLSEARVIIAADAGMGKSTLLRVVGLDCLSDEPQLSAARDRYAKCVPVWVPFALWTRMASERAAPPPLEEVVGEFFEAQSEPMLAAEMRKALASAKVLLLVDGLDEASDPTAARTVAAMLATFAESRNLPALITSRPHGLQAMGGFAGTWARVELAPFSDAQRHSLANLWFRVIAELEGDEQADPVTWEAQAERRASSLTSALKRNPGVARLSRTPLFLLALIQLHRHGQELPRSRFAAIERIIDQLVEHQPRRRAAEALSTVSSTGMHQRQRDRLLDDFAFALHAGELIGPVTDAASEEDAVARAATIVIRRHGSQDYDHAEEAARFVFAFAEERAGLLVKKTSQAIGFLHLSIQELLAARHLAQRSFPERVEFIIEHAEKPRWREPILYLLYLEKNETQVGELLRAIERATTSTAYGRQVRDTLLTDAVFSDLAHDILVAREIAERLLDTVELTGWGERQRHALVSAVDGLASETVAELCEARIRLWVPNRHEYGRASALHAMAQWPSPAHAACRAVLLRSLSADEAPTARAAAEVLPLLAAPNGQTKTEIKALLKASPSKGVIASSLYALGCGWADDPDVGELAAVARGSTDRSIALEGIRIRAKRNDTDEEDFDRFLELTYSKDSSFDRMAERSLIEHFAETRGAIFVERLAGKIGRHRDRNPHHLMPLIGSLILCDPLHPLVVPGMSDLLEHDFNIRDIFAKREFPADKIPWNPGLVAKVQRFVVQEKALGFEFYLIAQILPEPWLKGQILKNLAGEGHFRFWSARALVDVWGGHDPEIRQAFRPFLDQDGDQVASVAEMLPAVVEDKQACRAAFLRALSSNPTSPASIVHGFRLLGVAPNDDQAFEACWDTGEHLRAPAYQDHWRAQMILTFPDQPVIREMARSELRRRGGVIGAIATSYAADEAMTSELSRVLRPLPAAERLIVVSALHEAAAADDRAVKLLEACSEDTEGAVAAEATFGWMESLAARGTIAADQVEAMAQALDTLGPDYEARRTAGMIALAIADRLDRFAQATERRGELLKVNAVPDHLHKDDRYLRRVLRYWSRLVKALGSEDAVIERLEMTPDTILPLINPIDPNARNLFDIFISKAPKSPFLAKYVQINALARFAPKSPKLRALILDQLIHSGDVEYWGGLIAAEVFAEHFAEDAELRGHVIARFDRNPGSYAAAALAELLLRQPEAEIERLMREKTAGVGYDVATHFKLVAALSSPERVVKALIVLLTNIPLELYSLQLPRWLPAMVRRIEKDGEVRTALRAALTAVATPSVKVSFVSLLAQASTVGEELQAFSAAEAERSDAKSIPEVGFDLGAQAYRIVRHVLLEASV
jgi:NACHT domain-containing protein